jgi:type I restriction enzyme R subunit
LLSANRAFHKLLVGGVPVQYQKDGETRGDFVRLIDWHDAARNEFWAVNQFTIKGPHHTRRPDIILFVNGLPLVLLELKNPADQNADIWKAYDQIQTYKEQIPDVFQYNEVLVISDGTDARWAPCRPTPSASCSGAPLMASRLTRWASSTSWKPWCAARWRRKYLLDYLRYFVLFEDDGNWSRRLPATTSSTRCARPSSMWWRHRARQPGSPPKARAAWCGTRRAAARASP